MAEQHTNSGHPAMDYPEHERTYAAFVKMSKWITLGVVVLMVLMALTLI